MKPALLEKWHKLVSYLVSTPDRVGLYKQEKPQGH